MVNRIQVSFHNLQVNDHLEQMIREHAAALDAYHPQIIGCRVVVDMPHRRRQHGRQFIVRIELSLPGEDVVVGRTPTRHAELKDVSAEGTRKNDDFGAVRKDAELAIAQAFDLARRRLQDAVRRQRDHRPRRNEPRSGSSTSAGTGGE